MTFSALLTEALKLPLQEREALCFRLKESLSETASEEGALADEMQRRILDAERHPEDAEDWEDTKAEIFVSRGLKL